MSDPVSRLVAWWHAYSPDQQLILVCFLLLLIAFGAEYLLWRHKRHARPRRRKTDPQPNQVWVRCPNPTCFKGRDAVRHDAWCETCRGLGTIVKQPSDHSQG